MHLTSILIPVFFHQRWHARLGCKFYVCNFPHDWTTDVLETYERVLIHRYPRVEEEEGPTGTQVALLEVGVEVVVGLQVPEVDDPLPQLVRLLGAGGWWQTTTHRATSWVPFMGQDGRDAIRSNSD